MLMDTRTPVRCRADSDQVVEALVSAVLLSCSLRDEERYNPKEMPGCYARLTRMPPCHHQINGGGQIGGHCMAPLYSVHWMQKCRGDGKSVFDLSPQHRLGACPVVHPPNAAGASACRHLRRLRDGSCVR